MKRLIGFILSVSLIITFTVTLFAQEIKPDTGISVLSGGYAPLELDVYPEFSGDILMIPVRFLCEPMGYLVEFNQEKSQVSFTWSPILFDGSNPEGSLYFSEIESTATITIGSDIAIVNGEEVILDHKVILKSGRTLAPKSFFEEVLGMSMYYLEKTRTLVSFINFNLTSDLFGGESLTDVSSVEVVNEIGKLRLRAHISEFPWLFDVADVVLPLDSTYIFRGFGITEDNFSLVAVYEYIVSIAFENDKTSFMGIKPGDDISSVLKVFDIDPTQALGFSDYEYLEVYFAGDRMAEDTNEATHIAVFVMSEDEPGIVERIVIYDALVKDLINI